MGLAVVLLFAIYLNVTGQSGEQIATSEPVEAPVISEEPVAGDVAADDAPEANVEDDTEVTSSEPAQDSASDAVTVVEVEGAAAEDLLAETITVPGDDATYEILNAFRRDDGGIEITSTRTFEGTTTQMTRLVTCAPLAVGTIAEGEGARTDTPEMVRISLGSAPASLAAAACGALR